MNYPPTESKHQGVIHYLYNKYNKIYDQIIETNQSSIHDVWSGSWVLVNISASGNSRSDNFASIDAPKSNFSIVLKSHFLYISHYTLQTRTDTNNNQHFPTGWIFEGSSDGIHWNNIDEVEHTSVFQNFSQSEIFECQQKGLYSHFKFTQTLENNHGYNYFVLHKVEFFGILYDIHRNLISCITKSYLTPFIFL